ncbi:MAG: SAM-dependent methyltransferase [Anaerolineales bacterium]|nr:SAM-dependent methyltransferase [Anaerolineales bacterium]
MFHQQEVQKSLNLFFQKIRLKDQNQQSGKDKTAKIGQILSYLEIIHVQVRKYSKRRELVLIDCGAGNCYLSFLVYYFYTQIEKRPVRIHCLDNNPYLMENNHRRAETLEFKRMYFHTCDIADYAYDGRPDMVYSLHACDSATDKMLYLGLQTEARNILSVSCCQHTNIKKMKGHPYTGITRHQIFKEKLAYMVGDSLRAMLLEMHGYQVDIIEFASTRYTDKNIMLRARKGHVNNVAQLNEQYQKLQQTFNFSPALENYLLTED